jgi:hypothetical protein
MSLPPERLADRPASGDPVDERISEVMRSLRTPPRFSADASARLQRKVQELSSSAPRRLRWMTIAMPAALALALFVTWRPAGSTDPGIRARGARHVSGPSLPLGSNELVVFRVSPAGDSEPLGDTLHRRDELAFAYRTDGADLRLLVFGRDDRGRIYWYYPEWNDAADNPEAVALLKAPGVHELPAAIDQPLEQGRLEICSVFTQQKLRVREAEVAIERGVLRPACRKVMVIP